MRALLILNDAAYGSERSYDGLRLAGALARSPGDEVRVFLLGDAAAKHPPRPLDELAAGARHGDERNRIPYPRSG